MVILTATVNNLRYIGLKNKKLKLTEKIQNKIDTKKNSKTKLKLKSKFRKKINSFQKKKELVGGI